MHKDDFVQMGVKHKQKALIINFWLCTFKTFFSVFEVLYNIVLHISQNIEIYLHKL